MISPLLSLYAEHPKNLGKMNVTLGSGSTPYLNLEYSDDEGDSWMTARTVLPTDPDWNLKKMRYVAEVDASWMLSNLVRYDHMWDFRACIDGSPVEDAVGKTLMATPYGPICGSLGISLNGDGDYINIDGWEWGGATSIEVLVKHDSFNYNSPILDFGSGEAIDNIMLYNVTA